MTELKATPGPWVVYENTLAGVPGNGNNFKVGTEEDGYHGRGIAELTLWHSLINDGETEEYHEAKANAHLIAAAPDEDEALGECLTLLKALTGPDDELAQAIIQKAEKARAKARGETE